MKINEYELVTVYRGKNSATYLLEDFKKHGDDAKPLWVKQYPGDRQPFNKIKLEEADGMYMHNRLTKDDIKKFDGKWDVKALRKLLEDD